MSSQYLFLHAVKRRRQEDGEIDKWAPVTRAGGPSFKSDNDTTRRLRRVLARADKVLNQMYLICVQIPNRESIRNVVHTPRKCP